MSRGARELWSPSVNLPEVAVCAAQSPCCGEILSFTRTGSDVADTENPSGSPMARRLNSTRHVWWNKEEDFRAKPRIWECFQERIASGDASKHLSSRFSVFFPNLKHPQECFYLWTVSAAGSAVSTQQSRESEPAAEQWKHSDKTSFFPRWQ